MSEYMLFVFFCFVFYFCYLIFYFIFTFSNHVRVGFLLFLKWFFNKKKCCETLHWCRNFSASHLTYIIRHNSQLSGLTACVTSRTEPQCLQKGQLRAPKWHLQSVVTCWWPLQEEWSNSTAFLPLLHLQLFSLNQSVRLFSLQQSEVEMQFLQLSSFFP